MSEYYKDVHRYDDILSLPHHRSTERSHMLLSDRAAQFAPFAALTGYEEAIRETERLTEEEIVLDETAIEKINEKLYEISMYLSEKRRVAITYFRPDAGKSGGAYLTDVGTVKKMDVAAGLVFMDSGIKISMGKIIQINFEEL